jgi:long-chain acyl-CoA synthetase
VTAVATERTAREALPETAELTLPQLLVRNARVRPQKPAIREKEFGIWQTYTWADAERNVRAFALGLRSLGFARGDKLAVIGDNRPQLYWAMLAAQALGGVAVPVYQDSIAAEVQYVVDHSESVVVVAEDQEQVDKILERRQDLPRVRYVVYEDPRGLRNYQDPSLLSFQRVQELGREREAQDPDLFYREVERGSPRDVAIINYTSGTTGAPKGAMLTHRALVATARNFLAAVPMDERDEIMAYLPMAWIGDSLFSVAIALTTGLTVNCPEHVASVRSDTREIAPTVTFAPPRIWENILSQTQVRLEDAGWLARGLTHWFVQRAMESERARLTGQPLPWWDRVLRGLGEWLVFGPLRDRLGLSRVRHALTGGAAIAPEVLLFFRGIGVNLKQLYGLTECCAGGTVQRDGEVKLETVGKPLPGVEIRISEDGEILIRSEGLMEGYYKNPEATAQALRDGWLHTGDAGFFDTDGQLVVIDRAKDVSRLSDGSVFAPQYVENKLKFSPYIKEAVTFGHGLPYVAALLNVDYEVVGHWAEKQGIAYAGYPDLSQNERVYELVAREVERVNRQLDPPLRVKRFVILHKELDPDDAEITRTRKLRRRFIAEKYKGIVEALYDGQRPEVTVRATVTFEDGRTGEVERVLRIHTLF